MRQMTGRNSSWLGIRIDGLKATTKAAGAKPNLACPLGVIPSAIGRPFKYSLETVAADRAWRSEGRCERRISAEIKASPLTERRYQPLFQPAVKQCFTGDERLQRRHNATLVGLAGNRSASQRKPARGPPDRARRID